MLIATAIFLMVCQTGVLPIGFMYMHEVANHKACAVGQTGFWFLLVLFGLFMKPLVEHKVLGDYVFFMFGGLNIICTVIVYFFMKETKGLTEAQVARLYLKEEKLGFRNKDKKINE